jgi:hypothetical protein
VVDVIGFVLIFALPPRFLKFWRKRRLTLASIIAVAIFYGFVRVFFPEAVPKVHWYFSRAAEVAAVGWILALLVVPQFGDDDDGDEHED